MSNWKSKFKLHEIVRVKRYPEGHPDEKARVVCIERVKKGVYHYWLGNGNMPFLGNLSMASGYVNENDLGKVRIRK